jgi:hypothetical protein
MPSLLEQVKTGRDDHRHDCDDRNARHEFHELVLTFVRVPQNSFPPRALARCSLAAKTALPDRWTQRREGAAH